MTIEVALVISAMSLAFGIYQGVTNMKRNRTADDKNDATQLTTVIVKLENIGAGISDIKSDMRNVKDEVKDMRDRLIKVEESTKSAHHRIDELIKIYGQGDNEHE